MPSLSPQLDLFAHVACAYAEAEGGVLSNQQLYEQVVHRAGVSPDTLNAKQPIGKAGAPHSPVKRQLRWFQQTLKTMGVLEKVTDSRGVWRLTEAAGNHLHKPQAGVKLVAFSTQLGVAIWGSCTDVFAQLDEPISLCVSSPPYPLAQPRAYGGPTEAEYSDFICRSLEGIVKQLVPGGSIVLNISNDVFMPKSPARSLYVERLILALHDRMGLHLMDRLIWSNPSKPPGPIQWASLKRVQLNVGYEPVYWFTNDPLRVKSDNRRVLEAHSELQQALIAQGGEQRTTDYGDGAYRLRPGAFGKPTAGKIPKNVITRGHSCSDSREYRADAQRLGLPVHGAMQPLALPDFFIRLLSEEGDLCVDPFGGTLKTGMAAERLGRRWMSCELMLEYLRGAAERFKSKAGFRFNPGFAQLASVSQ